MAKNENTFQEETIIHDKEEIKEPPYFKVILHNDDYTTMDFVVMVLIDIFDKNEKEATKIMLNVHQQGSGIAGVYTREVGETKIAIVHRLARNNQFPLKCSLEKTS